MTIIGKIVKSNSHIDYVCQVFGPGEREEVPAPADYAFGRFVCVAVDGAPDAGLVGVIYDTILMNPEFGSLGPRLSPRSALEVFSPDYLNEKATLVGILLLGSLPAGGGPASQGIPLIGASVDALVAGLTPEEVRRFHASERGPRLAYVPQLMTQANPLIPHLVLNILEQVIACFPEHRTELDVLRHNLAWRTQVEQTR